MDVPPHDPKFDAYWRSLVEKQIFFTLTDFLRLEGRSDTVTAQTRLQDLNIDSESLLSLRLDEDFEWWSITPEEITAIDTVADLVQYYLHHYSIEAQAYILRRDCDAREKAGLPSAQEEYGFD